MLTSGMTGTDQLSGDIRSGVLMSTGVGRRQIARDEWGRDASPSLRSKYPICSQSVRLLQPLRMLDGRCKILTGCSSWQELNLGLS